MRPEESLSSPFARENFHHRSDEESAMLRSVRRERGHSCCIYLFCFVVILCIAVLVLGLVVVRVRVPSIKMSSVTFKNLQYGFSPAPFLNTTLTAEITIDNSNFGQFRYESTNASLIYAGITVGFKKIPKFSANARDSKKLNVSMFVNPNSSLVNVDYFSHDLANLKTMNVSYIARFRGRVRVLKVFNQGRISVLNCTMTLNLTSHGVQNIICQ